MLLPTPTNLVATAAAGILLSLLYFALRAIYNIYTHPLRKYPGPALWAASRLPWVFYNFHGVLIFRIKELHDKYGPVVRTAPDELSFTSPAAWKDIYGGSDQTQLNRDPYIYPPENLRNLPNSIIHANHADHARIRRRLAYAFSLKALEEQQPLISKHIDTLIKQLSVSEGPQNMCDWFNFVSFDIIGDLALGQSLGSLENGKYHPLARHLIGAFKAGILMSSLNRYIPLSRLKFALRCAIPKRTIQQNKSFLVTLSEQVSKRLESTTTRPDFISYMLKDDKNDLTMTKMDIQANVAVFFIGGSESGASLLAGTLFYLLKDSARMAKAVHEIRSTFANENDINFKTVSQLPYTLACLEEGLRVSTPTPFGIARRTTEPTVIADELVPANTSVSVPQWAAWHSAENFSRPNEFIPERWLDDKEFAGDSKNGFHPFSVGPRNCMGKNLAYVEMRLILARLLWNFDCDLADPDFVWMKQKAFLSWNKLPMMVNIKPVKR